MYSRASCKPIRSANNLAGMKTPKKGRRQLTDQEKKIADKLKAIFVAKKRELKFTQESLADYMGMTQGAVWQYLNGAIPPNPTFIMKFGDAMRLTTSEVQEIIKESLPDAVLLNSFEHYAVLNEPGPDYALPATSNKSLTPKSQKLLEKIVKGMEDGKISDELCDSIEMILKPHLN